MCLNRLTKERFPRVYGAYQSIPDTTAPLDFQVCIPCTTSSTFFEKGEADFVPR